jgi:ubiquinone/menaquinone biosynthesis C-methylase UbiE
MSGNGEAGPIESLAVARRNCSRQCFTYHAAWKLFRGLDIKSHPRWHAGFYERALSCISAGSQEQIRGLVCGAADESMLRTVATLVDPARLSVTLVDRCRTPLTLSERFAARRGLRLETRLGLAEELEFSEDSFDFAITDGLLSLIGSEEGRDQVIGRLHSMLKPGGRLIYTTRLTEGNRPLEYDKLGRVAYCLVAPFWRGGWKEKRQLIAKQFRATVRTSPFDNPEQIRDALGRFRSVHLETTSSPPSVALRVHPYRLSGKASTRLGVLAVK